MILRPSRAKEATKYGLAATIPMIAQAMIPLAMPYSLLVSAGLVMAAEINRLRYKYKINDHEIIEERGILNKSKTTAPIDRISQTKVSQNIFQKMLRYGDLEIETWGSPIKLEKISKPQVIAKRIREIQKDIEI